MKGSFKLHEAQDKQREKDLSNWIKQPICCVCERKCEGYYGRHNDSGTCSKKCEGEHNANPRCHRSDAPSEL